MHCGLHRVKKHAPVKSLFLQYFCNTLSYLGGNSRHRVNCVLLIFRVSFIVLYEYWVNVPSPVKVISSDATGDFMGLPTTGELTVKGIFKFFGGSFLSFLLFPLKCLQVAPSECHYLRKSILAL